MTAIGSFGPIAIAQTYRGVLPLVGASTLQLDLNIGGKQQALVGVPTGQPAFSFRAWAPDAALPRSAFSFVGASPACRSSVARHGRREAG